MREYLTSYDELPTRLEIATALLTNKATSESMGAVRPYSIRVPLIEDATIKALHVYSGLSQNKVIVELLKVALDSVFQEMSEEDREQIFKLRGNILGETAYEVDQPQGQPGEI